MFNAIFIPPFYVRNGVLLFDAPEVMINIYYRQFVMTPLPCAGLFSLPCGITLAIVHFGTMRRRKKACESAYYCQ